MGDDPATDARKKNMINSRYMVVVYAVYIGKYAN